jgi:hypothetical protein
VSTSDDASARGDAPVPAPADDLMDEAQTLRRASAPAAPAAEEAATLVRSLGPAPASPSGQDPERVTPEALGRYVVRG